jgi:hypothetical protein
MHTTNYTNTFIEVAADCPTLVAQVPSAKGEAITVAGLQYNLVHQNPYRFTSDEVLFQVHAARNEVTAIEKEEARNAFFSKGQPCFRASPLTKRYGWGVHFNAAGKMALYGVEANAYKQFVADTNLKKVKAMRLKKA